MSVKLHLPRSALRLPPALNSTRREARANQERPIKPPAPGVLDRVHDQLGGAWIRYGTPTRAVWNPVGDFARQEVFARLAVIDPRLIMPKAQRALRDEIVRSDSYRSALVAAAPGWTENHFVFGDGATLAPRGSENEIIVTFEPYPKFNRRGTLEGWQEALGPLVTKQPFLLFGLALAFVGPLLPFVPPDYLSPLFEFAGVPGSGKSLAAMVGVSAWAGNPESTLAGGESWNLSPGRFDGVKLAHRHGLLLLDEAAQAGSLEVRRSLIQQVIFGLTSSGMRQRFGDTPNTLHAQLAVISTSNRPLRDLIDGASAEREALHQRMITVPVASTRPHGIFDFVPADYESSVGAAEALRARLDEHWGTAGPAFVRFVQNNITHDRERFRARLARELASHRERLSDLTNLPRVQKCFALVAVAGLLARHWGVQPEHWGSPVAAVQAVMREAFGSTNMPSDPRAPILSYVERHRSKLIEVTSLNSPLSKVEFEAAVGFLRPHCDGTEVLIPAARLQSEFLEHEILMRAVRNAGHARTEGGRKPKLTIKTPRAICADGRVYCIHLG